MSNQKCVSALVCLPLVVFAGRTSANSTVHQIDLPQSSSLCILGPGGSLVRSLLGPPADVQIVNTRLNITFVSAADCNPGFDAGNLVLTLQPLGGPIWTISTGADLGWSGQGTFTATVETDLFNGANPLEFWEDQIATSPIGQIDGHFHLDTCCPDSRWEIEYVEGPIPGDANCDDSINLTDVDAFVLALIDRQQYQAEFPDCEIQALDINCDSRVDGADIPGLLDALL